MRIFNTRTGVYREIPELLPETKLRHNGEDEMQETESDIERMVEECSRVIGSDLRDWHRSKEDANHAGMNLLFHFQTSWDRGDYLDRDVTLIGNVSNFVHLFSQLSAMCDGHAIEMLGINFQNPDWRFSICYLDKLTSQKSSSQFSMFMLRQSVIRATHLYMKYKREPVRDNSTKIHTGFLVHDAEVGLDRINSFGPTAQAAEKAWEPNSRKYPVKHKRFQPVKITVERTGEAQSLPHFMVKRDIVESARIFQADQEEWKTGIVTKEGYIVTDLETGYDIFESFALTQDEAYDRWMMTPQFSAHENVSYRKVRMTMEDITDYSQ